MERKRIPFPDIAHFRPEEPLSPGMPTSAEESVFLSIPELAHTANVVVEYAHTEQRGKAKQIEASKNYIIRRTVNELVEHPERIPELFDACEMLKVREDDERSGEIAYTHIDEFTGTLKEALMVVSDKRILAPDSAQKLLKMMGQSAVYRPIAESLLRNALEQYQDTTTSLAKAMYSLTAVGVMNRDPLIMREMMKVVGLQTNVMPSQSRTAALLHLATLDRDDATLRLAMDIHSIFHLLGAMSFPDILQASVKKRAEMAGGDVYKKLTKTLFNGYDLKRLEALQRFYDHPIDHLGSTEITPSENIDLNQFPYNLVLTGGGPLRDMHNKLLAREKTRKTGELTADLHLPTGNIVSSGGHQRIAEQLRDVLRIPHAGSIPLERNEYWETLSYLLPEHVQSYDQFETLTTINEELKAEMLYDSKYLLNPRGDYVEIVDPALKERGFRSVTYHMNPENKRETLVTVDVGAYSYRMLLDEYFVSRNIKTRYSFDLPPESTVLQHIILSHLYEIRCHNRGIQLGDARTPSSADTTPGDRRGRVQRAHRRLLPEGENPTRGQILRALEEYHIDIIRQNREAAARGETRRYTWVCEVDTGDLSLGPVRSQRPHATDRLKGLF